MSDLEGCTCWSTCCDLGPHACICGNDCTPPAGAVEAPGITALLAHHGVKGTAYLLPEADEELTKKITSWRIRAESAEAALDRLQADERAKRPDREQIDRIQFEIDNVHQIHGDTCLCGFKSSRSRSRTEHLTALFAEAVLALEPEAREEAEYFRDGDGDLWKFTDKGEWFHEEEPGEFRQVLSIDAEDQTLTPVGHAELAPAPEVTDAEVDAARSVIVALAPYNMELRPDGSEDQEAAAYVSGVQAASDAIPRALAAAAAVRS